MGSYRNVGNKCSQYAMAALKDRRASIASDILECERKLRHLRESLVHVDACLRILDPDANPEAIPNKRPIRRIKLFRQGELGRIILDALRQARDEAMTTTEIVDSLLTVGGHGEGARRAISNRVRGNLKYLLDRGKVEKDLEGGRVRWRIA